MGFSCDRWFDATAGGVIANGTTDLFTALAIPGGSNGKVCTFSVSLSGTTKLYLRMAKNSVTKNMPFNSDTALVADALYTFSFICDGNATYTMRTDQACTLNYLTGVLSVE